MMGESLKKITLKETVGPQKSIRFSHMWKGLHKQHIKNNKKHETN